MLLKISTGKTSSAHKFEDSMNYVSFLTAIAKITGIPEWQQDLSYGFPPRPLSSSGDLYIPITSLSIENGSVIMVRSSSDKKKVHDLLISLGCDENKVAEVMIQYNNIADIETLIELCTTSSVQNESIDLAIRAIPPDNSCLFNAIDYLLASVVSPTGNMSLDRPPLTGTQNNMRPLYGPMYYRRLVADAIAANPAVYTTDYLEKTPAEYINWILSPDKWGGEIEISILSTALAVQIAVISIESGSILIYGKPKAEGADKRIYLLYDGIHYDAVVQQIKASERKTFPPFDNILDNKDDSVTKKAEALAKELKERKKFVNLHKNALKCYDCQAILVNGQNDALEHAKMTGHTNFGQI